MVSKRWSMQHSLARQQNSLITRGCGVFWNGCSQCHTSVFIWWNESAALVGKVTQCVTTSDCRMWAIHQWFMVKITASGTYHNSIKRKKKKFRNNIAQGSVQAETRLKVMCHFLRILYHFATFLSRTTRSSRVHEHILVMHLCVCLFACEWRALIVEQSISNYPL